MSKFYPDIYVESVKLIDFTELESKGITAILFDIDNTLATYDDAIPDAETAVFLQSLIDKGFKLAVISNNSKQRVDTFIQGLDIYSVPNARKPLKKGFKKIVAHMSLGASEIAIVGDQILTDIFGGNRCGMCTILVSPLAAKENMFFKVKRFIEKLILKRYIKKENMNK